MAKPSSEWHGTAAQRQRRRKAQPRYGVAWPRTAGDMPISVPQSSGNAWCGTAKRSKGIELSCIERQRQCLAQSSIGRVSLRMALQRQGDVRQCNGGVRKASQGYARAKCSDVTHCEGDVE